MAPSTLGQYKSLPADFPHLPERDQHPNRASAVGGKLSSTSPNLMSRPSRTSGRTSVEATALVDRESCKPMRGSGDADRKRHDGSPPRNSKSQSDFVCPLSGSEDEMTFYEDGNGNWKPVKLKPNTQEYCCVEEAESEATLVQQTNGSWKRVAQEVASKEKQTSLKGHPDESEIALALQKNGSLKATSKGPTRSSRAVASRRSEIPLPEVMSEEEDGFSEVISSCRRSDIEEEASIGDRTRRSLQQHSPRNVTREVIEHGRTQSMQHRSSRNVFGEVAEAGTLQSLQRDSSRNVSGKVEEAVAVQSMQRCSNQNGCELEDDGTVIEDDDGVWKPIRQSIQHRSSQNGLQEFPDDATEFLQDDGTWKKKAECSSQQRSGSQSQRVSQVPARGHEEDDDTEVLQTNLRESKVDQLKVKHDEDEDTICLGHIEDGDSEVLQARPQSVRSRASVQGSTGRRSSDATPEVNGRVSTALSTSPAPEFRTTAKGDIGCNETFEEDTSMVLQGDGTWERAPLSRPLPFSLEPWKRDSKFDQQIPTLLRIAGVHLDSEVSREESKAVLAQGLYKVDEELRHLGRPVWRHIERRQLVLAFAGKAWFVQAEHMLGRQKGCLCLIDTGRTPNSKPGETDPKSWFVYDGINFVKQPSITCTHYKDSKIESKASAGNTKPVDHALTLPKTML